jgi:protein-disulfide isomerase
MKWIQRHRFVAAGILVFLVVAVFTSWHYRWVVLDKVHQISRAPAPVTAQDHERGDPQAAVVLIEYSDLQCTSCRALHAELRQVQARVPFLWVFRHYPLEAGSQADVLAQASECAADQGRFWEYVDAAYSGAANDAADPVMRLASIAGADPARLQACLKSGSGAARVAAARKEGERVGVNVTPTFYVNGRRYVGAVPEAKLVAILSKSPG